MYNGYMSSVELFIIIIIYSNQIKSLQVTASIKKTRLEAYGTHYSNVYNRIKEKERK